MKTLVTAAGLKQLQERLMEKKSSLKMIREEKSHAYSASGDGWHDNPGWIQLGQQEEMIAHEVRILEQKLADITIIDPALLDTSRVQIGCKVTFVISRPDQTMLTQNLHIVGSGETDVKNGKISYDSPLGSSLYNMNVGEIKRVQLPYGEVGISVKEISYE